MASVYLSTYLWRRKWVCKWVEGNVTCRVLDRQRKSLRYHYLSISLVHKGWCQLQYLKQRQPAVYWEAWTFTFHDCKPLVFVWTPVVNQPSQATWKSTERERLSKFMHLKDKPKNERTSNCALALTGYKKKKNTQERRVRALRMRVQQIRVNVCCSTERWCTFTNHRHQVYCL